MVDGGGVLRRILLLFLVGVIEPPVVFDLDPMFEFDCEVMSFARF